MMLRIGIILVLSVLHCAQGRKCWHCENARSNLDCFLRGNLTQCLVNQEYCQNEVRAIAGGIFFEVTKRCKQDNSCDNNMMQNYTGVRPFQCQTEETHSVCRCCCGFDNCNGPNITCITEKPECEEPEAPDNGYVTGCYHHYPLGTKCFYKCRFGYELNGTANTICELNGTSAKPEWVPKKKPVCKDCGICPPLVDPEGGSWTCTDGRNKKSVCTFVCETGRVLIGRERITCSHWCKWDFAQPTCEKIVCNRPKPLDPNFIEPKEGDCTDEYNYGSTCTFQCHEDYNLVGIESIDCGDPINARTKRAKWNRNPPKCEKKTCDADLVCPEMEVGEECIVECDSCEEGGGSKICTKDGWEGDVLPCTIILCDSDPPGAPLNGVQTCQSNANECGDTCAFTCDENYQLLGSPTTRCLNTRAWSHPTPTCERSVCTPDHAECSGKNKVGDRCEITCPRCQSGGGVIICTTEGWSGSLPTCRTINCGSPPIAPLNGNRQCTPPGAEDCDDSCSYSCDDNYELIGTPTSTCLESGLWSGVDQIRRECIALTCDAYTGPVPREDVGSLDCNPPVSGVPWMVGAKCTLTCEDGYTAKQNVWTAECIRNRFGNIFWDDLEICCVECQSNTKIDMVVLFDTTVAADLWDVRIRTVGSILAYSTRVQNFEFNVTFIPFGAKLDLENQVNFMYYQEDQKDFLVNPLGSVTLDTDEDSNSGKAMRWALDHIFGFHNGRYPTIVLVTSHEPKDLAVARAAAREITEKKMHLRILPIKAETEANAGENEDILFDLVEKNKFVYTRAADNADEFNVNALDELITETIKLCNSETQNTERCLVEV